MRKRLQTIGVLAFCAFFAERSSAQVMSSPNYQLTDYSIAGGGGGVASIQHAAFIALEPAVSSDVNISANYRMSLGFLGTNDPKPTDTPIIFAITPSCGPQAGGTPFTIAGLNFDKFGVAATIDVKIGSLSAIGISVLSDTLLTGTTPPQASNGPSNVQVLTTFGSDTLVNGFDYTNSLAVYGTGTPGCTGPETVGTILCPKLNTPAFQLTSDHAPANSFGLVLVTDVSDPIGTDILDADILLHVGLLGTTEFILLDMVSDNAGIGTAPAAIPNFPPILGKTFYAQAIWYWAGACVLGKYDLSSSRGLSLTIEPH